MNNKIGFILQAEKGIPGGIPTLNHAGIIENIQLPTTLAHGYQEVDEEVKIGQPVYAKQNGHLALASSLDNPRSKSIGVALENGSIGYAIAISSFGTITLQDWTNVVGNANLVPGLDYFLDSTAGKMTNVAPNNGYLVVIGRAVSELILSIQIQRSILL